MASVSAGAAPVVWPALSESCFVKGRSATEEDVRKGCASFVIKVSDQVAGVPINIAIPQYALHVDEKSGVETPVIIIQAEEKSGIRAVGYKEVGTSVFGAALLREMKLLGTRKPT